MITKNDLNISSCQLGVGISGFSFILFILVDIEMFGLNLNSCQVHIRTWFKINQNLNKLCFEFDVTNNNKSFAPVRLRKVFGYVSRGGGGGGLK